MSAPTPTLTMSTTRTARPLRSPARAAAEAMVGRFATIEGADLSPAAVVLPSGARVRVDGASPDQRLVVSAHAVPSPLRHVDLAAVVQDVFTLALVRAARPAARTVLLVADEAARAATSAAIARTPVSGLVEIMVCP